VNRSRFLVLLGALAVASGFAFVQPGCGADSSGPDVPPVPVGGASGSAHDAAAGKGGASGGLHADAGGTSGMPEAGTDADGATDGDTCPPVAPPANVPAGWVETKPHACDCRIYVPGSLDQMPPPIEWEPCPGESLQDVDCRIMKTTSAGQSVLYAPPLFAPGQNGGSPLLMFDRLKVGGDPNFYLFLIAEMDGPVRVAFLRAGPSVDSCALNIQGVAEGKYAYNIVRDGPSGRGMLAGGIDSLHPSIVQKIPDGDPANFDVSSQWLLRKTIGPYTVSSWDGTSNEVVYDPGKDPDGLAAHNSQLVGGDVFFNVSVAGMSGTMAWSKTTGLRPLLRWYGDPNKATDDFGTDGKDMVWTYGEGILPGLGQYSKLSIMTAPYTLDPAVAQATSRRLRSDPMTFGVLPYRVGCGYAARLVGDDQDGASLLVVRLSDGVSWKLKGKDPMNYPTDAIGLTCDEVFFADPASRVGRVRIDSLGPGILPD
jgi:hypothetical protein